MTIYRSRTFLKQYVKLPEKVQKKVKQVLKLIVENPQHPGLGIKKMVNHEKVWEARIDIHYRMTFEMGSNTLTLRKIGTHEIYRNP